MSKSVMAAALLFTALGARAEMPQMLGSDPLSRQILTKTAQENGGVTAAVRVASGQVVELKFVEAASAPAGVKLAPAAPSPDFELKPAAALALKPAKAKPKKAPKRAVEQLKHVAVPEKGWGR